MKIQKTKIFADIAGEQMIVRFLSPSMREMSDAQKVIEELSDIVYNYEVKLVVINFAKLKQMTSAFLSKLITLNKTLAQSSIKLRLCCMAPAVEQAFKICKLEKIIPLYKTEEEALQG